MKNTGTQMCHLKLLFKITNLNMTHSLFPLFYKMQYLSNLQTYYLEGNKNNH